MPKSDGLEEHGTYILGGKKGGRQYTARPRPAPEWRFVRRRLQGGGYGVPREEVQTLAAMASSQNPVSLPAHPFERHRLFELCFCT